MKRSLPGAMLGLATLLTLAPGIAAAGSLRDSLHGFLRDVTNPLAGVEILEPITPVVERVAIRGTDFPVTSTNPGFTYSYNPQLGMFERTPQSLGPQFLERAATVGRGHFDVGLSYLYANLIDEDGRDFADRIFMGSQVNVQGQDVAGAFRGTHFSLINHVLSPFLTYGITDRWDVNVVVPLVYTKLELEGIAAAAVGTLVSPPTPVKLSDFQDDDAFGVGDVLVRTKYRFLDGAGVNLAGALGIRVPTGEEEDFHGLGDVTVTPSLIASQSFGMLDFHGQLGIEVNADDLERTRARYAIGAAVQPIQLLALYVEAIGSSSFVDDEFSIPKAGAIVPNFDLLPNDFIKANRPNEIVAFVPRTDVVDLALGCKVNVAQSVVAYVGAVVPLTDDSLRAAVIPTGGVEVGF